MPADVAPERQARLSKAYPKYARKYTSTDKILPIRAIDLTTHPDFRKAASVVAHKRHFIEQFQADLGQSGLRNKNIVLSLTPNRSSSTRHSLLPLVWETSHADLGRMTRRDRGP